MDTTDREEEIREIEKDLTNLHRRYVNLERAAWRFRVGFYVLVAALATFVLVTAVTGSLPGILFSTALFVVTMLLIWASARMFRDLRLIDWVGWWPRYPRLPGYPGAVTRSKAQAVEDMVAERVERLKHLKGNR